MSAVIDPRTASSEATLLRLEASRVRMLSRLRERPGSADKGPMKIVLRVAEEAGNESLRPIAQRAPLALVGVAAAGGALLMWIRPWRTLAGSALLAGMLPQLGARLVSHIPLASWIDALHNVAGRGHRD